MTGSRDRTPFEYICERVEKGGRFGKRLIGEFIKDEGAFVLFREAYRTRDPLDIKRFNESLDDTYGSFSVEARPGGFVAILHPTENPNKAGQRSFDLDELNQRIVNLEQSGHSSVLTRIAADFVTRATETYKLMQKAKRQGPQPIAP